MNGDIIRIEIVNGEKRYYVNGERVSREHIAYPSFNIQDNPAFSSEILHLANRFESERQHLVFSQLDKVYPVTKRHIKRGRK